MSERPGRYQRSVPGMIGALLVLLLVVAAFVVFRAINRTEPENPVKALDFSTAASFAREEVDFELLAPDELPDGWIATSVRFDRGRKPAWHLGTLTDEERYVGLEQAARPVSAMVEEFVDEEAVEGDAVTVGGEAWRSFTDAGGDLALVRRDDDRATTLVVGRVSQETLEELIATLR
jgi:Protein of unknown function (DUF4245)